MLLRLMTNQVLHSHVSSQLRYRNVHRTKAKKLLSFFHVQEEMASELRALQQQYRAEADAADARCAEASRKLHDMRAAAQRTEAQLRCGCNYAVPMRFSLSPTYMAIGNDI